MKKRKIRFDSGQEFEVPQIRPGTVVAVMAVLILLGLAWNMFFTVAPEEVGVVLTFGTYSKMVEPGLRFKMPFPIQSVTKVPVQRQLKQQFGYRTARADIRSTYTRQGMEDESLMLTGDLNVAVVQWTTQYRVKEPYRYLFKVRNPTDTFRDMNEAVMRAVVGDRSVTEVLTIGRQEIATEVERRLQELCTQYETGIKIEQIVLQDVNPPEEVKPSFNEVNQAQQERERMINDARSAFNRVIPKARGEALQTIQESEGYAAGRVNRAEGDATRFVALLEAYQKAPNVTRNRLYLETMQQVLPGIRRKIVLDENLKGLLPLIQLDVEGKP